VFDWHSALESVWSGPDPLKTAPFKTTAAGFLQATSISMLREVHFTCQQAQATNGGILVSKYKLPMAAYSMAKDV